MIFLATPHGGSKTAHFNTIVGKIAKTFGMRDDLVSGLRLDSPDLKSIQSEFSKNYNEILEITSVFEKKKIPNLGIVCNPIHKFGRSPS